MTIEQRIATFRNWPEIALTSHVDLEVTPLLNAALAAQERGEATVRLGLRNRKRTKRTKLAIGITGEVNGGGYFCTVSTADLLAACEDECAAIHALLSGAAV